MLFDVEYLNSCRASVLKEVRREADTPREAITKGDEWYPGLWVRVRQAETFHRVIFLMKKDGTLEKVF